MPAQTSQFVSLSQLLLIACDQSYAGNTIEPVDGQPAVMLAPYPDAPLGNTFQPPYSVDALFSVARTVEDDATGFKAVFYKSSASKEIIVAMAGTDGTDFKDWWSNLTHYGWNQWQQNRVAVLQLLDGLVTELSGASGETPKIHFTGQSLGGALAQYAAYEFVETHDTYAKSQLSLVTFNGLGGVSALREELPKRTNSGSIPEYPQIVNTSFDSSLASGFGQIAHYGSLNDLVWRTGSGHLGGNVYSFAGIDFSNINPETNDPFLLDTINAHKIETGYYYPLTEFDRAAVSAFDASATAGPLSQAKLDASYLRIEGLQKIASGLGNVFRQDETSNAGAMAKLLFGGMGSFALGDSEQVNALINAYVETRFLAGKYVDKDDEYQAAKDTDWSLRLRIGAAALGISAATPGPFGLILKVAGAIALAPVYKLVEGVSNDDGEFVLRRAFELQREGAAVPDVTYQEALERSNLIGAALGVTGPDGNDLPLTTMAELARDDVEGFAEAMISEVDWHYETAEYLIERASTQGMQDRVQAALNEFWSYSRRAAEGDATLIANVSNQFTRFTSDWASAVANINEDLVAPNDTPLQVDSPTQYAQKRAFWSSVLGGLESVLDLFVGTAQAAEGHATVTKAINDVRASVESVVIRPGREANPFDDTHFEPDASPIATGGFGEGSVSTFTVYLPYETGTGGQRVKLELAGLGVSDLSILAGGQPIDLEADGTFTMTVAEGQREATFSIVAGVDIDADQTLELSAQLMRMVDGMEVATHFEHDEATIVLYGESEAPPIGGREIRGDWAPKPYTDPSTGETYYQFDDLGNIERIPGSSNTTGFQESDNKLDGSSGADHIVTGDYVDSVYAHDGNDAITGSEVWGTIIHAGGGDDWVEALGYTDHGDLYGEFERWGRTIKLGEDKIYGGAGDDRIYGESEATVSSLYDSSMTATGLPGDWTAGGSGADRIYGGRGDDVLMGGHGEDFLVGGAGMDVMLGDDDFGIAVPGTFWTVIHPNFGDTTPGFGNFEFGLFPVFNYYPNVNPPTGISPSTGDPYVSYYKQGGGDDVMVGGAGKDILVGQLGDDVLYGGGDDDLLAGWEGADKIYGGDGDDRIAGEFGRYERPSQRMITSIELAMPGLLGAPGFDGSVVDQVGDDFLDGGAGNDLIYGEGGNDVVLGGHGSDTLYGDANYLPAELHGDDLLDGGAGDDVLEGNGGDDKLYGADGRDFLFGGTGNDLLEGGAGNDILAGGDGEDTLRGGEGADQLSGGAGVDQLRGGGGDDQVTGGDGIDTLFGEAGADSLEGGVGADFLYGGSGNDVISGGEGDDLIDGGAGVDVVRGGEGDDTYVVGFGYGADLIEDTRGTNRLQFAAGIAPDDLSVVLDHGTRFATISLRAAGDSVSFDAGQVQIGGVDFSGGTAWSGAAFLNFMPAMVAQGSEAGDNLRGSEYLRNDLRGEGGDDELAGNANDDTLAGGDGNDLLDGGSGSDRYTFAADEVGIDMLSDSGIAAQAYLEWFYDSREITDWAERGLHGGLYRAEGSGEGGHFIEYFDYYEEAYAQYSYATITYVEPLPEIAPLITRGDAAQQDELREAGILDHDVVEFGSGLVLSDLHFSVAVRAGVADQHPDEPWYGGGMLSVRWGSAGFDLEVPGYSYGFTGTNLLADSGDGEDGDSTDGLWRGYRLGEGIEEFRFADGSVYTLEKILQQATVVPVFDYLLSRGSGSHSIDVAGYAGIAFEEGIAASEVVIERHGLNLVARLADHSATVEIADWFARSPNVPNLSLRFANDSDIAPDEVTRIALTQNGTAFSDSLIPLDGFANILYGHSGDDELRGGTGDDELEGGDGFDELFGGAGNDTLEGGFDHDSLDGGGGNDILSGGAGSDEIEGGAGNDVIEGGAEDDSMEGGEGDDVYVFGAGSGYDEISEDEDDGGGGLDTMRFLAGVLPVDIEVDRDFSDLILALNGGGDAVTIFGWFRETGGSIERIEFADGTIWDARSVEAMLPAAGWATAEDDSLLGGTSSETLAGLEGDDKLHAFGGNDTLEGGEGFDYLEGGKGNDTYRFSPGDGEDEVYEEGGLDRIAFGSGIAPENVLLERDQYSLYLTIGGNGDTITVWDWLYESGSRVEEIEFADGTLWNEDAIWSTFSSSEATEFGDLIMGTNGHDALDGLGGVDEMWGYEGNDIVAGGESDDFLEGGTGNNLLEGGDGADSLGGEGFCGRNLHIGGAGDDRIYLDNTPVVIAFNAGDGFDTVSVDIAQPLTVSLGGLGAGDVTLNRNFNQLAMAFSTGDALILDRFYGGNELPEITLQIIGADVRTYDLTALLDEFNAGGPEEWPIADTVEQHLISRTTTHAIGGAIAYQYATTGSTAGLTLAEKQVVLGDPGFGVSPQSISLDGDNQAPAVASPIADQTADEDSAFVFTVPADAFSDPDAGDTLTFSASLADGSALPGWLIFDADARTFSGTPAQADVGSIDARVTATDAGGLGASNEFVLHVVNVNDFPVLANPIADQAATEDASFSFTIPADAVADEDPGDALYWSASRAGGELLPEWLTFDASTRTFTGTPRNGDVGIFSVQVIATDAAGASASDRFDIAIANTNDAPTVETPLADVFASEDERFSFVLPSDTFAEVDTDDTLTVAAALADGSALPAWLAFDAVSLTLSGTPLQADVGAMEIKVSATDDSGATVSDAFRMDVLNVNDTPVAAVVLADQSFEAGSPFLLALPARTFTDEDGDHLALSAGLFGGGALPSWLSFDPASGNFAGNPSRANVGVSQVVVTATDASGARASSDFGVIVRAAAGSSATGGSGDDLLYGGAGDETLNARGGSDYLHGDAGNDRLKGGRGSDVLQGGEGNDVLRGGTGQNVLDGGAGDDLIHGGQGSGFIVGGTGNDTLRVGRGNDVIAFNAGDGIDTVYGGRDGGNTLSFGGGIGYDDLSLSRRGKDLIVSAGEDDKIVLKNWYAGNHSVANLQVMLDASDEFDASSQDPLYARKVQRFDFRAMVMAFDQARAQTPGLTSWEITNALLQFHLSGTDDAALGGDLAYWYSKNDSLAGIGRLSAQQIIGDVNFGSDAQTLRPFNGLQEGFVKLT